MADAFILGHGCIHDLLAGVKDSSSVGGYDYIYHCYRSSSLIVPPVYGIHSFSVSGSLDYRRVCSDFGYTLERIPYTPLLVSSPLGGIKLMREFEWSNAQLSDRLNPEFVYIQDWYPLFQADYSLKQYTGILGRL